MSKRGVTTGFLAGVFLPSALFAAAAGITPAAAAQAETQSRSAEYRLNAGDTLDVFVWAEEKMQREVRVLPDGTFAFPLAGTIQAQGKTAKEVGLEIENKIGSFFRDGTPEVTVSVKDTAGMRFYVIGKVRAPGSYSIGRSINALQALALAGGAAEFANVEQAIILHENGNGQTVERVSLSDVLKGGKALGSGAQANSIPMLRPGDVLVIP